MDMKKKLISIVVIVRNEEKRIRGFIQSLLKVTGIESCDVLFVDGASTDGTAAQIVMMASQYPFIRIVQCNNYGYSIQRNIGAHEAKGDYVLFLSADTIPNVKILHKYSAAITKGFNCIQGSVINYEPENAKKHLSRVVSKFYKSSEDATPVIQLSTVNVCIKTELLRDAPFSENIDSYEDKLWFYNYQDAINFTYLKLNPVYHLVHETPWEYLCKIYKEVRGLVSFTGPSLISARRYSCFEYKHICRLSLIVALFFIISLICIALKGTVAFGVLLFLIVARIAVFKYKNKFSVIEVLLYYTFYFAALCGYVAACCEWKRQNKLQSG